MALRPLEGFRHFTTHHCVTGSMRHIYAHNDYAISEEMLLGLGAGVSFSYWHFKGQTPFMGGRGGFRPPSRDLGAHSSDWNAFAKAARLNYSAPRRVSTLTKPFGE